MPGIVNALYVATSVNELNNKSELPANLTTNCRGLVRAIEKIYDAAKEHRMMGDEEKAYIQFMKYLNAYTAIKASLDYKKDKKFFDAMLNMEKVLDSMKQAEEMAATLKQRYSEMEAEKAAKKVSSVAGDSTAGFSTNDEPDDPFSFTKTLPTPSDSTTITKGVSAVDKPGPVLSPTITAEGLYELLRLDTPVLLIDARSEEDFSESHIALDSVDLISIPEEHLEPGILTTRLRTKLSPRNVSLFDARANYSRIVLLDWESKYSNLKASSPLSIVKDAIHKWDQQTRLASEPQVLEGGYRNWLMYYPQHTTNSQVAGAKLPKAKIDIPDLDAISYDFDFADEDSDKEDESSNDIPANQTASIPPVVQPQQNGGMRPLPTVNRANKPSSIYAPDSRANSVQSAGPQANGVLPQNGVQSAWPANIQLSNGPSPATRSPLMPSVASSGAPAPSAITTPASLPPPQQSGTARPSVDRNLKPQVQPQPAPRQTLAHADDRLAPQEDLYRTLSKQNERIIAEAGNRLKQLNADRAQIADLTQLKQTESQAVADLMRKKKELESDIRRQEETLSRAKQVQNEHVSTVPQVQRNLKPNLEDWESRLADLQLEEDSQMSDTSIRGEVQDGASRQLQDAGRLAPHQQAKLIEEHNNRAKQALHTDPGNIAEEHTHLENQKKAKQARAAEDQRRATEKAKLSEEQRKSAEQARLAEEQKKSAEQARLAEEQRKSAEQARLAEEQRRSAEQARLAEEQRRSAEQARLAEENKRSAEKARLAEEQRKYAEQARLAEENRRSTEKARIAEEKRRSAEKAKLAEEQKKAAEEQKKAAEEQAKLREAERKAAEQRSRGPSVNDLPAGWQRRLDEKGQPYYFNYHTQQRSQTPPQPVSQAPAALVPSMPRAPVGASHIPARPATTRASQGSPPIMRSKTRLKSDETTFGVDGEISSSKPSLGKMKKFNSIPNLTQLDDGPIGELSPSSRASFDRTSKPVRQISEEPEVKKLLEPVAKLDSRRLANLSPEYGKTYPGLTGLYNMGNTCYMNSAIQCLSHTLVLCKYFCDDTYQLHVNKESSKGSRGAISTEFALLLKCLWTGNYRYIVPRDFKFVFGRAKADFDHFKQMDSQEFLHTLLDTLHEDLNSSGHLKLPPAKELPSSTPDDVSSRAAYDQYQKMNQSVLATLFTGLQRSMVTCRCGEKSSTFDTFNSLPLEIRTSNRTTLRNCLDQYQRTDEAEGYKCAKCHKKHSTRKLDLYHLPAVLLVFFKRFSHSAHQFSKKTNHIDFPDKLVLRGIGDKESKNYQLYGVVNHFGSLDSGHYTAFCKSAYNNSWYKFNDETVSSARTSDTKSSAAYILFYTSIAGHL